MPRLGIALRIATRDCIVLLYTTGLYCLKSSGVKPLSWIILKAETDRYKLYSSQERKKKRIAKYQIILSTEYKKKLLPNKITLIKG